jgi:lipase
VIVFVHGLTDSGSSWNRVLTQMSPYFDAIAYDLRGHGLSDAPPTRYSTSDHVADLIGLLDQLGIHFATLVGHSMGAEVCAQATLQAPDRVARLVLVDPPWNLESMQPDTGRRKAIAKGWYELLDQMSRMSPQDALAFVRATNPRWHADDMETWASARRQVRRQALEYLDGPREPWKNTIVSLRCPTLIVCGDAKRGAAVSDEQAAEACALSRHVEAKKIPDAGHAVYRDCLAEFVVALSEFLAAK